MLYWVLKVLLSPVMLVLFRVRAHGRGNVPRHGAAIIAANHNSFCDSFFLPLVIVRRLTFVAKAEYFDDWRTAWFFRAAGQIPIRRGGGPASQRALDSAKEVLNAGRLFAIYPEGTRSPDGRLYKGHTGVARLALECGVPVYPVALHGTRAAQPIGQRLITLFSKIDITFGEPIDFSARYGDRRDDPIVLRQITDEIMFEIGRLSGQQYVDSYASRSKPAPATSAPDVHTGVPVPLTAGNGTTTSDDTAGAAAPARVVSAPPEGDHDGGAVLTSATNPA